MAGLEYCHKYYKQRGSSASGATLEPKCGPNGPLWHDVYDRVRYWSNCVAVSRHLEVYLGPHWVDGRNRSMRMC